MIKGGIFHHFVLKVLNSQVFLDYEAKSPDEQDCSLEALRAAWCDEELTKVESSQDMTTYYKLQSHPLIWLFKICCWNTKLCCVPIFDLESFEEFFNIYSIEVML